MRCARTTGMKGGDADAAVLLLLFFFYRRIVDPQCCREKIIQARGTDKQV